jgi:hypothetical protein
MKKIHAGMFLFALAASFLFVSPVSAKVQNSYTINNKYVEIKIQVSDSNTDSSLRDDEGIINLKVNYKKPHEKNVTVNITCPENRYDQFADVCSQTYRMDASTSSLRYRLKDDYGRPRNITMQFSIGEKEYFKEVGLSGKRLPVIEVTAPKKGKTYKEGGTIKVAWKPYKGDFNTYSIHLENDLIPGFGVHSLELEKELNTFSYDLTLPAQDSTIVDAFLANYREEGEVWAKKMAKNFFIVIEAHDENGMHVAKGFSSLFKVK